MYKQILIAGLTLAFTSITATAGSLSYQSVNRSLDAQVEASFLCGDGSASQYLFSDPTLFSPVGSSGVCQQSIATTSQGDFDQSLNTQGLVANGIFFDVGSSSAASQTSSLGAQEISFQGSTVVSSDNWSGSSSAIEMVFTLDTETRFNVSGLYSWDSFLGGGGGSTDIRLETADGSSTVFDQSNFQAELSVSGGYLTESAPSLAENFGQDMVDYVWPGGDYGFLYSYQQSLLLGPGTYRLIIDIESKQCGEDLVEYVFCGDYGQFGSRDVAFQMSTVPVPAAVWLFGSALAGLGWLGKKQTGEVKL